MSLKTLSEMRGNEALVGQLMRTAGDKSPRHAYLLIGERGSGKRHLAMAFATALLCTGPGEDACGTCASCRKAMSGSHPDMIFVRHEKADNISVGEVREQLVNTVAIRPNESDFKIYIVAEAEKMNVQAQNAILKTIEEPPSYAVILLLTDKPEALLPTIRSRCIEAHLSVLSEETISAYLAERFFLAKEAADAAAAISQGNLGRARQIAEGGHLAEEIEEMQQLFLRLSKLSEEECAAVVDRWGEDKEKIADRFCLLTLWFRDLLLFKATKETEGLCFKESVGLLRTQAGHCSYEEIDAMIAAVATAQARIAANANEELSLLLLFLTIRDCLT